MKSESGGSSHFEIDAEDLPDGWISCTFGDIADVLAGGTPTASDDTNFSDEGYPWITPADLSNFNSMYIQRGRRSLSEKGLKTSSAKMVPKGTVLMSSRAPIGYVAIAANPISTNQGFKNFICHEEVAPEYIYYWIKYLNPYLEGMGSGSTFAEISGTRAKKIPIKYPPLAEQQRIVARVEALLMHVNAARARLSRVPLIMKKFRQGVLTAACSGRLTEGWREENPSDVRADQIYEKIQNLRHEKFKSDCESAIKLGLMKPRDQNKNKQSRNQVPDLPELPIEWKYYRLEDISYLITDGTHITPKYQESGIPFLSVKNVRPFLIRDKDIKHISQEEFNQINQRCNPEREDILYTKVGATYGYAAINRLDYSFSIFVSLALVKPVREYFSPEYAEIVMNSEIVFEQARDRISGIGTPDLHLIEIRDFRIPFPPLAEQHEIVRRVGLLFERADAFDREVVAASRRCERLTQAVLGKAFRGDLVAELRFPMDGRIRRSK